jgi:hypothetical protein
MTTFRSDLDELNHRELIRHRALDAARWLACSADTRDGLGPSEKFLDLFPGSVNRDLVARWRQKTAVGSAPSIWGSALFAPPELTSAVLALSQPTDLIARLLALGARKGPLNTAINAVAAGPANFQWAGSGRAKAVSAASFERVTLTPAVVSGILPVSNELLRFAPGSMEALKDLLVIGAPSFTNEQLVDPTNAGTTDPFSPRSLTNMGSPVAASSTGDVIDDLRRLVQAYVADGGNMSSAVLLISSTNASALALYSNAGTGPQFPNLDVHGGVLAGVPAIAADALSDQVVMFDLLRLVIAEGELDVKTSRMTSLEMTDTPTADGGIGTGASLVSLWQNNLTAFRVDRRISWTYTGPVSIINSVNYLAEGSPS